MTVAIAGSALPAIGMRAQDQAIVGIQAVTTYSADVRITAVDPNARTVTVPSLAPASHFDECPGSSTSHPLPEAKGIVINVWDTGNKSEISCRCTGERYL
jgi:hypothetical protein